MNRRFLSTPAAVASAVRNGRDALEVTQAELARRVGVDHQFIVDLEAGEPCAELGKMLTVLAALGIRAAALPAPPAPRSMHEVDLLNEVIARFE